MLDPERDEESGKSLVIFSAFVLQQLALHSPRLTHLSIPITRSRGDQSEVGIYRALSHIPRLEHVHLRLEYSIGPDEQFWIEESNDRPPLSHKFSVGDTDKIPVDDLKEAFSNGAVDEKLAKGIFNLVAGEGRNALRYLRLEARRKALQTSHNAPGTGDGQFENTLRWFNRSFVCTRDVHSDNEVVLLELDQKRVADAEELWIFLMSDEEKWWGEEVFIEAFKSLWPQKTEKWWRDWESLPLNLGEVTEVNVASQGVQNAE